MTPDPRLWRLLPLLAAAACAPAPEEPAAEVAPDLAAVTVVRIRDLDPPAPPGSFAPSLRAANGEAHLTWLEPAALGEGLEGHRVRFARLEGDGWSEPSTVAAGSDFFANWADFPAAVRVDGGAFYAHWLAKTGEETYAYSIFLARSSDGGASWTPIGKLNDDDTPTEHGFVSWLPEAGGARAFWLDGRAMERGGAMAVRTALVGDEIGPGEVLDRRVCECCSTDAVQTPAGPMVVYRDRSEEEIRDVYLVRREGEAWSAPREVSGDGWKIPGCPVNGPEADAEGERMVVAWFTASADTPKVRVAFSQDAGTSFGTPIQIDRQGPLGRVDVVLSGAAEAVVSWLATVGERGEVRLRRVTSAGALGEPVTAGTTAASRAAGFPRLARLGDRLLVAWVELEGDAPSRVRVREIPIAALPAPA